MTSPQSQILTSLEHGLNIDKLLQATGIDKETFMIKVYSNELNIDEWKAIKLVINEWENGQ